MITKRYFNVLRACAFGAATLIYLTACVATMESVDPVPEADQAPAAEPSSEVASVPTPPPKPKVMPQAEKLPEPPEDQFEQAFVTVLESENGLVGLRGPQLRNLFGQPLNRAQEPPYLIWSFHGPQCVLEVFLYPDLTDNNFQVLKYRAKDVADDSSADERTCLVELYKQNRKQPA